MKKSTKNWLKQKLAWLLIVLMSINSFGAVVGDSDGPAFTTKDEFEKLKSNFENQIINYTTSLDEKINGAIASYLSGNQIRKPVKIDPLVSNYGTIQWQPNLKVYGRWMRWTNNSTRTSNSTDQWFEPSLCEKRWQLRANLLYIYDFWEHAYNVMGFSNAWDIVKLQDGATMGAGTWSPSGGYDQAAPTLCILQMKATDSNYYIGKENLPATSWGGDGIDFPLYNMYAMTYEINVKPHYPTWSGIQLHKYQNAALQLHSFTAPLDPGDDYISYSLRVGWDGGGTNGTDVTSNINASNAQYPWVWRMYHATGYANWGQSQYAARTTDPNFIQDNYFAGGCTWHWLNDTYKRQQANMIINMMLGTNYDLPVNIANYVSDKSEGYGFDMSIATESAVATLTAKFQSIYEPSFIPSHKERYVFPATTSLLIPHWPTEQLRNLSSNTFRYKNKALKIGQGLPIIDEIDNNGYLQIEFDYDIKNVITSLSYKTAQSLFIDLKKGDYMDKSTNAKDYYDGYDDLVDIDTTNLTIHKYQNYEYPTKTGHAKMTIPIEKGETVWFRMRPENESGGYYANMSNLQILYVPN